MKMKKFTSCPFCSGDIYHKFDGIKDRLLTTTKTFSISECKSCGMALLNPMPTGDVSKYYPTNYLSSEEELSVQNNSKFDIERWYRYNQYRYDFGLMQKAVGLHLKDAKSYIDIGCGSGERVTFAKDEGCQKANGVDKFDFAKNKSKQEVGIINSEIINYKPTKKFQVASLFHVMEHIENPAEMLNHIRAHIIAKDGVIIVQVPNYGAIERKVFKKRWFSFDVPRHVWQFNERSMKRLLNDTGYDVIRSYQLNAPLHPVTIVPSLFPELDIQRIWVNQKKGIFYKRIMTILWAGMTILTIPLSLLQNILNRSSMLTVIAKPK